MDEVLFNRSSASSANPAAQVCSTLFQEKLLPLSEAARMCTAVHINYGRWPVASKCKHLLVCAVSSSVMDSELVVGDSLHFLVHIGYEMHW